MFQQLQYELGATKKAVKKTVKRSVPKAVASGSVSLPTNRIVHIVGQCENAQTINLYSDKTVSNEVKKTFDQNGWNVKSSEFVWKPELKLYWFRIVVEVLPNFSDADINGNAFEILKNFSTLLGSAWFSNIQLSLEFPKVNAPKKVVQEYERPTNPTNSNSSSNATNGDTSGGSNWDFMSALGGGLGLSTPVVLAGVGLVLLIALKK